MPSIIRFMITYTLHVLKLYYQTHWTAEIMSNSLWYWGSILMANGLSLCCCFDFKYLRILYKIMKDVWYCNVSASSEYVIITV